MQGYQQENQIHVKTEVILQMQVIKSVVYWSSSKQARVIVVVIVW